MPAYGEILAGLSGQIISTATFEGEEGLAVTIVLRDGRILVVQSNAPLDIHLEVSSKKISEL